MILSKQKLHILSNDLFIHDIIHINIFLYDYFILWIINLLF